MIIIPKLVQGLRSGALAYSNFRLNIIFDLMKIMSYDNLGPNEPKLTDLLHISEDSGGLEPYFLFINDLSQQWVTNRLNSV